MISDINKLELDVKWQNLTPGCTIVGSCTAEVFRTEERLSPGHRMCAGCGATIAVRNVLRGLHEEDEAVITCATGCLEVSSFMYPYTAWKDSFIHNAFENAGATCSGVEAAYRAIGFQSLSGAMERNHDMVYVCYDNGAYMNTGIQRSSATPMYADTTTTPVGSESDGKAQNRKDLTQVIAAHNIPYVAQTTFVQNFKDLHTKAEKAIYTEGAAFLNVMAPCPRGWRYNTPDILEICQLAVDTCFWPLFEVIDGEWIVNYVPKKKTANRRLLTPTEKIQTFIQTRKRRINRKNPGRG